MVLAEEKMLMCVYASLFGDEVGIFAGNFPR
jgi:hypothetical protein